MTKERDLMELIFFQLSSRLVPIVSLPQIHSVYFIYIFIKYSSI